MKSFFCVAGILLLGAAASAQQLPEQPSGIIPYATYGIGYFDEVSLGTGDLSLHIPLLSYPQKGSLPPVTLSVVYVAPIYAEFCQEGYTGIYPFDVCDLHYEPVPYQGPIYSTYDPVQFGATPVIGPFLHALADLSSQVIGTPHYGSGHVSDSTGATHIMGQVSSSSLYSIDATGISVDGWNWSSLSPSTIAVYDKNGIQYSENSSTGTFFPYTGTIKDRSGNTITGGSTSITDSIGRSIPAIGTSLGTGEFIPAATPGCTTANYPGISTSGTVPITFCYSTYTLDYPASDMYSVDWSANANLLHTVELPNGKKWTFDYDGKGALYSVTTPTGAVMTYSYFWNGVDTLTPWISGRTLDLNGTTSYSWAYNYQSHPGPSTETTVTDPNCNDSVHHFTPGYPGAGFPGETEVRYYQGTSTSTGACTSSTPVQLKTVDTDYASSLDYSSGTVNPFYYNDLSDTLYNVLPKLVTTTDNTTGQKNATYYCYDNDQSRSGDANMAYCPTPTGATFYDVNYPTTSYPLQRGIVTAQIDFDYGTGSSIGSPLRITRTDYKWLDSSGYAAANVNLVSIPSWVKTYDGSSVQKAETDYTYDESADEACPGTLGLPTTFVQGLSGDAITTHIHYNCNGMPSETVDANAHATTLTYQCSGSLPYVKTDPLSHVTTYGYDCNTGLLTTVQDPNGAASGRPGTVYTYDSMRDVISVSYPDGGSTTVNYHSYATPLNVTMTQSADPDPAIVTSTQYDSLVRPVVITGANGATSETTYDGLNRLLSVSNPHFSGSTDGYTSYSYDGLGRRLLQCNQDNGTGSGPCTAGASYQQWAYAGNVTSFQDEVGNFWARTSDALGRMINVVEPGTLSTTYTYSALGDLTNINQVGNGSTDTPRTRSFTYNSLSRLLTSSNPETGIICYGTTGGAVPSTSNCTPSYDGNGNLLAKTDARAATTNFYYDYLNRLTKKTYSLGSGSTAAATPTTCYVYDTNPGSGSDGNFLGRLTQEGTVFGTCPTSLAASGFLTLKTVLGYDPMGRVKRQQQCQLSSCSTSSPFNSSTDYDLAGNQIAYTNGLQSIVLTNNYDAAGHLLNLNSSWADGTHPGSLFSGGTYGASGALTGATLGTSLNMTRAYDTRLRIAREAVTHP